jgi:hypothetical protein
VWLPIRTPKLLVPLLGTAMLLAGKRPASADDAPPVDRPEVDARASTYATLFRRALLPGPGGAAVTTDTALPVYLQFDLRGRHLDTAWAKNSVDVELSAWANAWALAPIYQDRWDGDLLTANVSERFGPLRLTLGRQIVTRGAARFAQFDGLSADLVTSGGFGVFVYGGFTVLPHWADRPGYYQLGSARDTLLDDPGVYPRPDRGGWWLGGAQVSYNYGSIAGVGVSLHEQHEYARLGRRDLGVDGHWSPSKFFDFAGRGLLDLDGGRIADGRLSLDLYPAPALDISAAYRHVTPALLLSRQSVLSVFATDPFDEVGSEIRYRVARWMVVDGDGYLEMVGRGELGVRTGLELGFFPDAMRRLSIRTGYRRVSAPDNGYHSARVSLRWRVIQALAAVGEHYVYLYDQPIRGISMSSVENATLEWSGFKAWKFLLGSSLFSSPYARWDAQALAKVSYTFGGREDQL